MRYYGQKDLRLEQMQLEVVGDRQVLMRPEWCGMSRDRLFTDASRPLWNRSARVAGRTQPYSAAGKTAPSDEAIVSCDHGSRVRRHGPPNRETCDTNKSWR